MNSSRYNREMELLHWVREHVPNPKEEPPANKDNFNVFTFFGIQNDEVRTHSKLIAELLSPDGRHEAGGAFLARFLEQVGLPTDTAGWEVSMEKRHRYGRWDIVLENKSQRQIVVLENKINSQEGDQQLDRYLLGARSKRYGDENIYLIFLTVD